MCYVFWRTDSDSVVCSWPWQWFAHGKGDFPFFVTSNRCIPVINNLGRSAVVFCACEIIQLFSFVFGVVRVVRALEFRLVILKITTLCSDRDSCFWHDLCIVPRLSSRLNRLTLELNPSAQRCRTRFLLEILIFEPCISLIYAWKTNKCNNYSFSLLTLWHTQTAVSRSEPPMSLLLVLAFCQ
jgi:hypothetical protein